MQSLIFRSHSSAVQRWSLPAEMHLELLPVLVTRCCFFLWSALSIARVQAVHSAHLRSCWTQPSSGRLESGTWTAYRGLNLSLNHLFKWFGNWFRWANAGKRGCSKHIGQTSARYKDTGRSDPFPFLKSLPESLSKVFDTP